MQEPKYIHYIQNLIQFTKNQKNKYIVYTYILVDDEIKDINSLFFYLDSFDELEKAIEYKNNIIKNTHFPYIFISSTNHQPIQIKNVDIIENENTYFDKNNQLINFETLEDKLYDKELKEFKQHQDFKNEMENEVINEDDKNNIEYFKKCIFQCTKYNDIIYNQELKLKDYKDIYNHNDDEIVKLISSHPEYKSEFLPFLYNKLKKRNELELYHKMKKIFDNYF